METIRINGKNIEFEYNGISYSLHKTRNAIEKFTRFQSTNIPKVILSLQTLSNENAKYEKELAKLSATMEDKGLTDELLNKHDFYVDMISHNSSRIVMLSQSDEIKLFIKKQENTVRALLRDELSHKYNYDIEKATDIVTAVFTAMSEDEQTNFIKEATEFWANEAAKEEETGIKNSKAFLKKK